MTYDRQNHKIGFWKTNCSELWKSLHYLDPSATPPSRSQNKSAGVPSATPPSHSQNTSVGVPPTIAPEVSLHTEFPGRLSFKHVTTFYAAFSNSNIILSYFS